MAERRDLANSEPDVLVQEFHRYSEIVRRQRRENADDGGHPDPTTRVQGSDGHFLERFPILPAELLSDGRPSAIDAAREDIRRCEATQPREVFNEGFYTLFPWARGIDPFDEARSEWKPAEWYLENRDGLGNGLEPDENAEVPPVIAFVNGLISLELDDLGVEEADRTCGICLQPYREGEPEEMPVELPCGHIFGKECLLAWLSDIGEEAVHSACCPICRKIYVREKREHFDTEQGLRQLLRDTNYLLTGRRGLTLMEEGREAWEGVKAYVNGHLAELAEERVRRRRDFMASLRDGIRDYPSREAVDQSSQDAEAPRVSMTQTLDELERDGTIAMYLDTNLNMENTDVDSDEYVQAQVHLIEAIPQALRLFMDDLYDEMFLWEPEGEETSSEDEEMPDPGDEHEEDEHEDNEHKENNDQDSSDATRIFSRYVWCEICQAYHCPPGELSGQDIRIGEQYPNVILHCPGTNQRASPAQAPPATTSPASHAGEPAPSIANRSSGRYQWMTSNETNHWTWLGGDESESEDTEDESRG